MSEMTNTAGGVFTVLFSIVLTVAIVRVLGRVAGGRYDGEAILQLLLYTSLNFLAPLLAMSLFLAVLITLIRSWMQNEMVIWFSSGGLSLLAWICPVLTFALPIILLTALVSLAIGPWARAQTEVSRRQFSQREDTSKVVSGQFIESRGGKRIFFIEQANTEEQYIKGIFVAEFKSGKTSVVTSQEGRITVNSEGDRYVELQHGRQYETSAGKADSKITEFENYGIRIDVKPDDVLTPDKTQALPTSQLLANPTNKNMGQFLWRLSWPFVAFNLALFAIPLSHTSPRAGRSLNLVIAILFFILYLNSISIMQSWVSEGKWNWLAGFITVHGLVLAVTIILFIRRIWLQRWLPPQFSIGYWRTRNQ